MMTHHAIRQRALEELRKHHPKEYRNLYFREWGRDRASVVATTETEVLAALRQPEPFYMEAR